MALEAAWDQLLLGFPSPTDGSTTLTMLLLSGMFRCILVLFLGCLHTFDNVDNLLAKELQTLLRTFVDKC